MGQKRTFCSAIGMSALPPKADIAVHRSCPLSANSGHWTFTRLAPYDPRFSSEKARNG